jgi:DNA-binding response OmpR family regulator
MAKRVLIIDGDTQFVTELTTALETLGVEVTSAREGKEGLELAKKARPDLVVLCVELRKTSGYSICSKLKKDEDTRAIPVILVSAEATQKTFDDHRKLKVGRADEYLRKPIAPEALIEKIEGLIGSLAEETAAIDLDDDALAGIEDASAMVAEEPIHLEEMEEISVDADDHEAAPTSETLPSDSELDLLDAAFDNLEQKEPAAEPTAKPTARDEEEHDLLEILPEHDAEEQAPSPSLRLVAGEAEAEESAFQSTIAAMDEGESFPEPLEEPSDDATAASGGRDKDYFQLKERLAQREKDLVRVREELVAKEKELAQQRDRETELERELEGKQPQIKAWQQKTEALMAGQRRAEKELSTLREDLKQATSRLQSAEKERDSNKSTLIEHSANLERMKVDLNRFEQRARDAEKKLQSTGSHAEELGAELAGVRAQLEEATTTGEELRRRLKEIEDLHGKGEERLLRAYQRIKGDERLKEKTRKALSIALQLLEDTSGEEEERRT